jgi:hypothetical protein
MLLDDFANNSSLFSYSIEARKPPLLWWGRNCLLSLLKKYSKIIKNN